MGCDTRGKLFFINVLYGMECHVVFLNFLLDIGDINDIYVTRDSGNGPQKRWPGGDPDTKSTIPGKREV